MSPGFTCGGFNPDQRFQRLLFDLLGDDNLGERPLVEVQAGANDTVGNRRAARKDGRATANALGDVAEDLVEDGINDLMLFTLPDLGRVPKYARRANPEVARSATAFTAAYNRRLDKRITSLQADGTNVLIVDAYALFNSLLADPASWGVRNTRVPCIDDEGNVCTSEQARRRAFFDRTHPNAIVHRGLAEVVLQTLETPPPATVGTVNAAAVAPVPLPLPGVLLPVGLLALSLVARWRR